MLGPLVEELSETLRFRDVVSNTVRSTLRLRYRRSALGFLWTLLNPLLFYTSLALIFSYSMSRNNDVRGYLAHMFSGGIFFGLMSSSINQSPSVFIANEGFIKKVYLPKLIYVLNMLGYEFINSLLVLSTLAIVGLAIGAIHPSWALLYLPITFLMTLALLVGTSCILAVVGVYFRDVGHIIPVLMNCTYFLTPILWYAPSENAVIARATRYNVFYYFVELFRGPLVRGEVPSLSMTLGCAAVATVVLVLGIAVVKRFDNRIVFKL